MVFTSLKLRLMTLLLLFSITAQAGIIIESTRVIYPEEKKEVPLGMTNNAKTPRLMQAWIDNGLPDMYVDTPIPFIVIPPVFRLDPGKGQVLRIIYTNGNMPQDRESVLWLNVLEIQPKNSHENSQLLFSIHSRLKIFFRPIGLPGSPDDAYTTLRWRLLSTKNGYAVACDNPSAYNVSFFRVSLREPSKQDEMDEGGMCPAKGKQTFAVQRPPDNTNGKVHFTVINDYGGFNNHEASYRR